MKRRAVSLALIASLLLSMLIPAMPTLAEAPAPEIESIADAEFAQEVPSEEAPAEPVEDAQEAPAEEISAEETQLAEEEQPAEEVEPIEEQPVESQPSEDEWPEAEPSDAEALPAEADDRDFEILALGSDNVRYAGVTYISRSAFERMDEENQADYIAAVDAVTALLDDAVVLEDVVFAVDKKGRLNVNISMPITSFSGEDGFAAEAPEIIEQEPAEPEAEEPEVAEPEVAEPEGTQSGESDLAEPGDGAQAEEVQAPIEENMDLIEALKPEAETIAGSAPVDEMLGILDAPELKSIQKLFWNSKNFFYEQLGRCAKSLYNAGYKTLVQQGRSQFTATVSGMKLVDPFNAVAALMDCYPYKFEYARGGVSFSTSYRNIGGGRQTVTTTIGRNSHYKASLESSAKKKTKTLVNDAYAYAKRSYPDNPTYGIIRYFDEWLCKNNYYDKARGVADGKTAEDKRKRKTEAYFLCHSGYGTLLKGFGVCESYALAMSRLMDAAGIPNIYATGQAGGSHAWNYVQMANGVYYLQDTTWDDPIGSATGLTTRNYLLSADDGRHFPDGAACGDTITSYTTGKEHELQTFDFPSISRSRYSTSTTESFRLSKSSVYLEKGKSEKLKLSSGSSYYDKFTKSWSSSDSSVAEVDSSGKVSAKKAGRATITMSIAGQSASCTVYVYQFTGLSFTENGRANLTKPYTGDVNKAFSLNISVDQPDGAVATAQSIRSAKDLAAPKATVTKGKSVAKVSSATLSGNTILLMLTPLKLGDASVTVKFAGKSAKLKLQVRKPIQSSWFELEYSSKTYTGKALKPKVRDTIFAPIELTSGRDYGVSYADNVNAGTATVTIRGKGNYSGTCTKNFTIGKASIGAGNVKIVDAKAQTYNGAARKAQPTVKLNGKALKAGVDYEIRYDGSSAAPVNAGSYSLSFVGLNYNGNFSDGARHSFTVNPAKLAKLKLSAKDSVKYSGAPVSASSLNVRLKSGSQEIPGGNYRVSFRDAKGYDIGAPSAPGSYFVVVTPLGSNIDPGTKRVLTKKFTIRK